MQRSNKKRWTHALAVRAAGRRARHRDHVGDEVPGNRPRIVVKSQGSPHFHEPEEIARPSLRRFAAQRSEHGERRVTRAALLAALRVHKRHCGGAAGNEEVPNSRDPTEVHLDLEECPRKLHASGFSPNST